MNIGAGWIKKDKNGKDYLSCYIEIIGIKFYFSVFRVAEEEKMKHPGNYPDYHLVSFSERKENNTHE